MGCGGVCGSGRPGKISTASRAGLLMCFGGFSAAAKPSCRCTQGAPSAAAWTYAAEVQLKDVEGPASIAAVGRKGQR